MIDLNTYISYFMVIFAIGSSAGWLLEFIYRNVRAKNDEVINPGFLGGPYLPIYGFGLLLIHIFGSLQISYIPAILLFALSATVLEFVTGYFFFRVYRLRLWDYTKEPMNIQGFICPRYSIYWLVIGAAALKLAYPLTQSAALWMNSHSHFSFYLGMYYGVVLSDVVNSFNIAASLSKKLGALKRKGFPHILDYENFTLHLRRAQKLLKERNVLSRFLLPFGSLSRTQMEGHLDSFFEKLNIFKAGK